MRASNLIATLAAALAGCGPSAPPSASRTQNGGAPGLPAGASTASVPAPAASQDGAVVVANTSWMTSDEAPNTAPMISFTADRASGSTGCNEWSAGYRQYGPALGFEEISETKRACEPGVMETERAFLQALRDTEGARMEGEELVLYDIGGGENARFHRVN